MASGGKGEATLRSLIFAFAIGISVCAPTFSHAQQLIGSYVARLSEADHFNSRGQRLTSAAAVIRQDRANFHRYGIKDQEDEVDTFFADEGNRAALEQMLERGRADPGVLHRIVNGTPLIRVDIYRGVDGLFVRVALLDQPRPVNAQLVESYVALLSDADHFNSKGERLISAAAVIRQDRANFHRFGIKDPEDEGDTFFADEGNRAALEQMLEGGRSDPDVLSRIVNGTPVIRVDIYRTADGPFVRVTLLN
jgi:hypothetical protein